MCVCMCGGEGGFIEGPGWGGVVARYLAKCMQLYLLLLFVVPLEAPGWEFSVSLPQRILAGGFVDPVLL